MRFQYDHANQQVRTDDPKEHLRGAVRRILILFLLFGCAAFFLGANGASDRDSDVASKIRSLEALRFEAQQQRNIAALDALLDEGLMWVDANGGLSTKAGYLGGLHEPSSSQVRIESLVVRVSGHMAIVVGIYNESGIKDNRPYRQRCRFIDTWTFKHDKWVLISAAATSAIS